jgi:hypothetical protein
MRLDIRTISKLTASDAYGLLDACEQDCEQALAMAFEARSRKGIRRYLQRIDKLRDELAKTHTCENAIADLCERDAKELERDPRPGNREWAPKVAAWAAELRQHAAR